MKKLIYACALVCLIANSLFAGFKLPSSVYTYDKIDEAAEKAKEEGKPLCILITEKDSN